MDIINDDIYLKSFSILPSCKHKIWFLFVAVSCLLVLSHIPTFVQKHRFWLLSFYPNLLFFVIDMWYHSSLQTWLYLYRCQIINSASGGVEYVHKIVRGGEVVQGHRACCLWRTGKKLRWDTGSSKFYNQCLEGKKYELLKLRFTTFPWGKYSTMWVKSKGHG